MEVAICGQNYYKYRVFWMAMDPPRRPTLFRVLHLLPHLLDDDLHVHRTAGGVEVLGLRGQGVGLAVELLHEEIEPPAGRLVGREHAADLLQVAGQAIELLIDVQPLDEQRQLLLQTVLIDARGQLLQPLIEPRPQTALHLGHSLPHLSHLLLEAGAAQLQNLLETQSLAGSRGHEILDGAAEERLHGDQQLLAGGRVLLEDAGPAQHIDEIDGVPRQRAADVFQPREQPLERLRVDLEPCLGGLRTTVSDRAVDLAPTHLAREALAQLPLGRAQLIRQAKSRLEEAVIDTAQLADQRPPG